MRRARADKLARLGLSAAKIRTIKAIGTAISKGDIDLDAVAAMEADKAHAALIALHGIGPWTADIYLLFCLGHADAWPAGDLALQEAAPHRARSEAAAGRQGDDQARRAWRPCRGVAAHLLWAYYRVVKRREGAPFMPSRPTNLTTKPHGRAEGEAKRQESNGSAQALKQWPVNSTDRGSSRAAGTPSAWWCSSTAMAPTATT